MAKASGVATVDVIVDVLECVSKERAFEYGRNCLRNDGCFLARVEDRTQHDEGWACVAYFHPSAQAYGRREKALESHLGPAAMDAYRSIRVEAKEEMTLAQMYLAEYRARRAA